MDKEKKNLLVFGYGLAALLCFFGMRFGLKYGWSPRSFLLFALAAFFIFITLFHLPLLKKIYSRWMIGAHFIGRIVTTVILTVLFYGLFGLAGIILRVLGKDLLDRKFDLTKPSYWIKRERADFDKARYQQQF